MTSIQAFIHIYTYVFIRFICLACNGSVTILAVRHQKFAVELLGTITMGVARCDQPRALDLLARNARVRYTFVNLVTPNLIK